MLTLDRGTQPEVGAIYSSTTLDPAVAGKLESTSNYAGQASLNSPTDSYGSESIICDREPPTGDRNN